MSPILVAAIDAASGGRIGMETCSPALPLACFSVRTVITIALVLAPDAHRVAAPQARVEQQVEGEPFPRTERPVRFEAIELLLRPGVEAVGIVGAGQELDALGRVGGD